MQHIVPLEGHVIARLSARNRGGLKLDAAHSGIGPCDAVDPGWSSAHSLQSKAKLRPDNIRNTEEENENVCLIARR